MITKLTEDESVERNRCLGATIDVASNANVAVLHGWEEKQFPETFGSGIFAPPFLTNQQVLREEISIGWRAACHF